MSRRIFLCFLASALSAPVWASTEEPARWLGVPMWVWAVFNLIVFWGAIGYFAGPAIRSFLAKRKSDLRQAYAVAREQEREIAAMRESLDRQIAELRAEVEVVAAGSAAEGEKEREQIIADARKESARLLDQAERQIGTRVEQAKAELLRSAAQAATRLAEERLLRDVSSADRDRLFDHNVRRLQERSS